MKTSILTGLQWPSLSSISSNKHLQPQFASVRPRFTCCLRLEGHGNADISKSSNGGEAKQTEVWRHFKEAQQNIIYLNKQRLKAVEELNRMSEENQLLRDQIEQLEAEKQSRFGKDKQSLCWELLLRIDSMVLTGMVNGREASDLRRLIMDHRVGLDDAFADILDGKDAEFLAALRQFSDRSKKNAFHVLHICTEMEPLVSVGCLASYVTGLSRALQRRGHFVEVILPKYASLDLEAVEGLRETEAESYSYFNGQLHENRIWNGVVRGIGVTLIEPHYYSSFFNRESVYGYSDDFERFSYFSRASLDYILKSGKQPDVLHIHNWETAIVGPLFWDVFAKQGLEGTRILFTCHNLNLQSLEQPDKLALCGLDPLGLHRADRLQDNNKTHFVNILKGGLVYSNKVVLMPSMHSKNKVIQSLSHGLESTLNTHKEKLVVSPYGFDSSTWDPSTDSFLPDNYNVDNLSGKTICKVALQQYLGLSDESTNIVVGCILSDVSDVDLENLKATIWNAVGKGVQRKENSLENIPGSEARPVTNCKNFKFIIIGNSNTLSTNREFQSFQEELKDDDIYFVLEHDQALSHLIFAGSDIILCQSFDDPIYQAPLKALRYGAAPIAINSSNNRFRNFIDHDNGTSKFSRFIISTFGDMSVSEALDEIKNSPSEWKRKIMQGMAIDFSWDAECCDIHISAYAELLNLKSICRY